MILTAPKRDLLRILTRTVGVAEKKSTMPILAHVLLDARDGMLHAAATDLFVSVETQIEAEVERPGAVSAPAKDLLERVKAMPEGTIRVTVSDGAIGLRAVGAKREFRLRGLPGSDFPARPEPGTAEPIAIAGDTLAAALTRGAYAVSADETRPHLNSALVEWDDGKLRIVSTDGHRLALHEVAAEGKASMLVSLRGLVELRRLCAEAEDATMRIVVGTKERAAPTAFFTLPDVTLAVKLVDAQFPPYQQVIPRVRDWQFRVDRRAALDALRAVMVAASKRTEQVKLRVGDGALRFTAEDVDAGDARDEVFAEHPADERTAGLNGKYLAEALAAVDGDAVAINISGELDPIVIEPVEGKGHTAVVMPMRV